MYLYPGTLSPRPERAGRRHWVTGHSDVARVPRAGDSYRYSIQLYRIRRDARGRERSPRDAHRIPYRSSSAPVRAWLRKRRMRATGRLRGLLHALGVAAGSENKPQDVITAPPAEDVSDVEDDGSGLPVIPWGEIMQHRFLADIWVVVDGYVYDMTEFISSETHPGGEEIPLQ